VCGNAHDSRMKLIKLRTFTNLINDT